MNIRPPIWKVLPVVQLKVFHRQRKTLEMDPPFSRREAGEGKGCYILQKKRECVDEEQITSAVDPEPIF